MAVMGRNLAMNCAEKGFNVAVYNRTTNRMKDAVKDATEQKLTLNGYADIKDFVTDRYSSESLIHTSVVTSILAVLQSMNSTLNVYLVYASLYDVYMRSGPIP